MKSTNKLFQMWDARRLQSLEALKKSSFGDWNSETWKHFPLKKWFENSKFDFDQESKGNFDSKNGDSKSVDSVNLDSKNFDSRSVAKSQSKAQIDTQYDAQIAARVEELRIQECIPIVIWNGVFRPQYTGSVDGLEVSSFEDLLRKSESDDDTLSEEWFGFGAERPFDFFDRFLDLNSRGIVGLRVRRGAHLNRPLQILVGNDHGFPRTLVTAEVWLDIEEGASVQICDDRRNFNKEATTSMSRLMIRAQSESSLELLQVQNLLMDEQFEFRRTELAAHKKAKVKIATFSMGRGASRNSLSVRMKGPEAQVELWGLSAVVAEGVIDHHTLIDHEVGENSSRQNYKGILDDHGRLIFHGRVRIRPHAQKSSTEQTNKNLLLSADAEIDSLPQLEIEADDVKATHGFATGQLDESEVFYLRSRGIRDEVAEKMLIQGFGIEVVEQVDHPVLRRFVREVLSEAGN